MSKIHRKRALILLGVTTVAILYALSGLVLWLRARRLQPSRAA